MNFKDIFNSSFLESVSSFSLVDCLISLALALVLGLFVFLIYKKSFNGVMYSANFGISLVALSLITTLVISAVSSNVILSLGMVGALSIVRFRTAVKEPVDIAFIFWSIAIGIVLGAGLIPLAVIGSVFIGIFMLLFVNKKRSDQPYMLILHCLDEISEKQSQQLIQSSTSRFLLKSKTVSTQGIELAIEIRLKEGEYSFINQLSQLEGVKNASLVTFNGDYMA
ncbi:MAG: DUF4956 domain-containing protein [Clostridia bacterium]|nr:DUF4956 domain-containing protein [Clostridia bacterium]